MMHDCHLPGEGWAPLAGLIDLSRIQVSNHRQLRPPATCSAMCSSRSCVLSTLCWRPPPGLMSFPACSQPSRRPCTDLHME